MYLAAQNVCAQEVHPMANQTSKPHIRVDEDRKGQATEVLKVPNARTRAAMEEARAMMAVPRAAARRRGSSKPRGT